MKYLRVSVTSPYSSTERSEVIEVDDDFDPDGKDVALANEHANEVVSNYAESWWKLLDANELEEDERIDLGLPLNEGGE
ncbi:hypothetical protein [Streptomyces sp. NPDC092295]|uniref:hypothetical protein n=1 Tax=Streptomyces sp. NPDC092295 TaxID=3366011 RepID=UPI0037F16CAE